MLDGVIVRVGIDIQGDAGAGVPHEVLQTLDVFATMSSDELKKSVAKRLLVLQRSINLIQFIRLQIQHFISAFCFFMGNLL